MGPSIQPKSFVLITGATSGLGRSMAEIFCSEGYGVILHGRTASNMEETKKLLQKYPDSYVSLLGDLSSDKTIQALAQLSEKKDISILINNAGECIKSDLDKLSSEQINNMVALNLSAAINLTQKVYSFMKKRKSGIIVNIGSLDSLNASKSNSVYCATKYGLRGFTDSLRMEARDHGVRVVGVYPGGMKTESYRKNAGDEKYNKAMEPRDIAKMILIACQDNGSRSQDDLVIRGTAI